VDVQALPFAVEGYKYIGNYKDIRSLRDFGCLWLGVN
jgi:hypothetical protein